MAEDDHMHSGGVSGGSEWLVDAHDCQPEALRSVTVLQGIFNRVLVDLGLHAVADPVWRVFPGAGGVSGMLLLGESHLTCHTFPESGLATFNLYCCRARPPWPWDEHLSAELGARKTLVTVIDRGQARQAQAGDTAEAGPGRTT